eukprot:c16340_g1_i1 orf=91-516(+)
MERGKAVRVEVQGNAEEEWKAAKLFMAKGPSATLQYLKEEPKALLQALDAQAMEGPLAEQAEAHTSSFLDHALARKQEAWKALGSMSKPQAKRLFVELLSTLLPYWKSWHAPDAHTAHTDEASRILSDFSHKTGLTLRAAL